MNKEMIEICLEEIMFDKYVEERWGFDTAGNIGSNLAVHPDKVDKHNKNVAALNKRRPKIDSKLFNPGERQKFNDDRQKLVDDEASIQQKRKTGRDRGKTVLATAYAGTAAYLIYKGIKSLYSQLKAAKTPEAKAKIKSKIKSKKADLAKAKKGKK